MERAINIVVTCTKRKSQPATSNLRLRSVRAKTVAEKLDIWLNRLGAASSELLPGRELYAGDHWSIVKSLADTAAKSGLVARVWVCSAGYGLISLDSKVRPYAATFTPGLPDSVARGIRKPPAAQVGKEWWGLLTKWSGPNPRVST